MEERKKKIRVKDLVIYADNVQIINQDRHHGHGHEHGHEHEHEHRENQNQDINEPNRRGPWDWFWSGNRE
ncbi:hypothetical protein [Bacillus sp. S/N-304-OC-R1]|uniref:hypothetical protein n=1 Tax=Bacillus sp. S/N-304-OC-R1 TaxID=2758034 RepID=UPI001C8E69E6|nr:hypothetical protein [Bacillus sp. S/N-304-OC-R1]MBY0123754.1 hypothetical protein [Bacillus sp. S/N-304-OC-R1]